jgi:hypothetical protein
MNNYPQFREKWDELLNSNPKPLHLHNCLSFEYSEFVEIVMSDDFKAAAQLVERVYAGDALILKNALNEESVRTLKSRATSFGASVASTRLKIVDGCPDWHEINDGQGVPEGGYQTLDHSFYFSKPLMRRGEGGKYSTVWRLTPITRTHQTTTLSIGSRSFNIQRGVG